MEREQGRKGARKRKRMNECCLLQIKWHAVVHPERKRNFVTCFRALSTTHTNHGGRIAVSCRKNGTERKKVPRTPRKNEEKKNIYNEI